MAPSVPISVMLPAELRTRLEAQAGKRALKLSTALKMLLEERLQQLEQDHQLSRAEEWQRAQVWGSWDRHQKKQNPEVPWEDVTSLFDAALGRPAPARSAKSASPKTSRKTSQRRSRG